MIDIVIAAIGFFLTAALAYMGVHVTLHIPEEDRKRRWKFGFCAVAIAGCILIVWQTWRNNNAQALLHAQLDKIQKNTETPPNVVVENKISTPIPAENLQQKSNNFDQGLQSPAIQRMTNRQLRGKVLEFTQSIREFDSKYELDEERQSLNDQQTLINTPRDQWSKLQMDSESRHLGREQKFVLDVRQLYVGAAAEYREELLRRLGPQTPHLGRIETDLFWNQTGSSTVITTWSMKDTAQYLERLARELP